MFWETLFVALLLAIFGVTYYVVLRFKRRVRELDRQLQVSMAKKLDAMVIVVKQLDETILNELSLSRGMAKQWSSKLMALESLENQVRLSRDISSLLISLKNRIKSNDATQPLSLILEEVESEFRRLLLIYNNEAKALNGIVDQPLLKVFVVILKIQKVVTFDHP